MDKIGSAPCLDRVPVAIVLEADEVKRTALFVGRAARDLLPSSARHVEPAIGPALDDAAVDQGLMRVFPGTVHSSAPEFEAAPAIAGNRVR